FSLDGMLCKHHFSKNGQVFFHIFWVVTLIMQSRFAHPYSPWERGTNENQNGLLREFIPKGRSLHHYDIIDIQSFQDALNSRPRRILGYRSAAELMPEL
ncbi:transposase, partial [Lacticaseibacillus paracasei]|uniref:transposase n=1 Tax=Lacticaseibacillus paracasei TaxID=1597 RepID=UPI003C1303F8